MWDLNTPGSLNSGEGQNDDASPTNDHGFPPKVSSRDFLMERFSRFCIDPYNTYIGLNVAIGEGTIIEPSVYIFDRPDGKRNIIGKNCRIDTNVKIREWFELDDEVHLGHCAEVVRSKIGKQTQTSHWCHIGDAIIGAGCNIAAGVIFCNYDGKYKRQTILEDDVFIGSGAKLIPTTRTTPLVISRGAFIAAGAIISKNVKENSFVKGVNMVSSKVCMVDEIGWELVSKNEHPILRTQLEETDQGYP